MTALPNQRIEALTGIRGFAALWVAYHHTRGSLADINVIPSFLNNWLNAGWLGVDLFFILSGFVIAHVHAADFERASWHEYRRFLLLRVARIYPAHLTMVLLWLPVVAVAAIGLAGSAPQFWENYSPRTLLHALTLTNGWGFPHSEGWNLPSWSVGSEWFAYLTFPIWAVTVCRLRSALPLIGVLVAVIVLMYARAFAVEGGSLYMPSGPWFLTRVLSAFVIGCCVQGLYRVTKDHPAHDWAVMACLALLIALPQLALGAIWNGAYIAVFAVVILCAARATGPVRSLLSSAPLVWLGNISYSLYLSHALVIVVVVRGAAQLRIEPEGLPASSLLLAVFTLLALLAADGLYRFVEDPARRYLRNRWLSAPQPLMPHASVTPQV